MAHRHIAHEFDCSAETFWERLFFVDDYITALFRDWLKFERWDIVERYDTADGLVRVIEAVPPVRDLPGPIKKAMKHGAGYTERGEYFRSQSLYTVQATPKSMADKVTVTGEMRVAPIAEGRCRRTYDAYVEARIFGVGSLVENKVLDDLVKSYDKSADFTRRWLLDHGLSTVGS